MKSTGRATLVALIAGLAFWGIVSAALGGIEPWDAGSFWTIIYPAALALSAMLGLVFPRRSWAWGAIVLLAQVPVVVIASGAGPLLAAGVVYAAILSIPAVLVSWIAGVARRRFGTSSAID